MKVLLLNPPHPAIGSRIPLENLPPLGLLAIGGPLIDDGHRVRLLNGDLGPMSFDDILADIHADPDQIQALYVTPHRWTPFFRIAADRTVIQTDVRRWDYKHQVLSVRRMAPWRVFLWVKFIEAVAQLRPRALRRLFFQRDPKLRHATRWYYRMGRRVWFHEIRNFLFRDTRGVKGLTLREFWGEPQEQEEQSMVVGVARGGAAVPVSSPQRSAAVPR